MPSAPSARAAPPPCRELDLRVLQEALAREAAEEQAEAEARAKRAADVRRYREQLALMMEHEAEESAERDAMIEAVAREQQARRDAELAARDEARRRLMAEVQQIRQQQIRDKQARHQAAMEQVALERQEAEAAAAQEAADAKARQLAQFKKNYQQRLDIQTQMVAKAHLKAAEEDEKIRAVELAHQAEQRYMGKVQQTLQATAPPTWHGRRKFDFYS